MQLKPSQLTRWNTIQFFIAYGLVYVLSLGYYSSIFFLTSSPVVNALLIVGNLIGHYR